MSGVWHESDISSDDESDEVNSENIENMGVHKDAVEEPGVSGGATSANRSGQSNQSQEPAGVGAVMGCVQREDDTKDKTRAKWLSGSWPLKPFDGNLPLNKRKAEWIRFRDQFERIVDCKEPVGPAMKLTGMKIFAGDYLLSVIEMEEKAAGKTDDIYAATIVRLNRYFGQTCDLTKERIKFRDLRMNPTEHFVDWVLRLEKQANFCEFEADQRKEELLQAVLTRSVPEISDKLYEMSGLFLNDLDKILAHGKHLDYIRTEAETAKQSQQVENRSSASDQSPDEGVDLKPVYAVDARNSRFGPMRRGPFRGPRSDGNTSASRPYPPRRYRKPAIRNCYKCGEDHELNECKAWRVICHKCRKVGHYAHLCRSSHKYASGQLDRSGVDDGNASKINQLITGTTCVPKHADDPRMVTCTIGEEDFIFSVDSGATVNTITASGWQQIKRSCRSVVQDVVLYPEEVLNSYANRQPLEVECSFRAHIGVGRQPRILAKFFVVKGTSLSLLSFETARNLNLITIGHPSLQNPVEQAVNSVEATRHVSDAEIGENQREGEFPKVRIGPVKFRVDESVVPKQIIRYNIPKAFEPETNERLRLMEVRGIIERADREDDRITFVSPLVLVPKGVNDFRIVVDYREVNKAIIREPYPMPSLDKIWTEIPNGTMFFSKLDLKDAYFHIELDESVRTYTTFMTADGLMRFTRLAFGLSCAPEQFQRVMVRLLMPCRNTIVYLDDILIYGRTLDELRQHVAAVQRILRENNLTINEAKSMYDQTTVDFLGFTLSGCGILPMQQKISDILMFERPKDSSEVRSFLGMLTFISPFIVNFSHKTKLLRDLLAGNVKFNWTEQHQRAFDALKKEAETDLIQRGFFNEHDHTILYVDASPWGLGAVLVQEEEDSGNRRIIACASKSLTAAECRYPQLHREALAIVWGMEKFAYYLLGRRFTLRSDSEALMFMKMGNNRKDVGKRILSRADGWLLRIDHFFYNFEHVAGKDNIADAASRIGAKRDDPQFGMRKEPHELCAVTASPDVINDQLLALTNADVKRELLEDEELQLVIEWLEKKEKWPARIVRFQPFQNEMYLQGELLMKQEKMVLPGTLRKRAVRLAHRSHPGMSTMKNFLRQGLWWPGMDRDVEEYVKSCPECQLVTVRSNPLPITMTKLPKNPWDYVSMDFASASDSQNWKALVLTDNYSRFLVALPMEKTDTEAVKRALRRIFNTYYIPKTLKADNGPPFNSAELATWLLKVWGVKLIHSTPLNPTENGLVERSMQGINKISAIAKLGKMNWKECLADYVAAYNSWPHHVTKIPPAELMFGRTVRSVLPNLRTDQIQHLDEELRDRDRSAKFVRNAREDDARKARETEVGVGDTVLVAQTKRDKADAAYKNVFHEVIAIQGAGRATIRDVTNNKTYDRNVKCLKKFVSRDEHGADNDEPTEEEMVTKPGEAAPSTTEQLGDKSKKGDEEGSIAKRRKTRDVKRPQRYLNWLEQNDE